MEKIALITDSSCDLPKNLLEKFGVKIIPLQIIYDNKIYRDGIDVTPEEIYKKMPDEIPKTSMPSIGETLTLFEKLKDEGYTHVLAILISSGLSGTFSMVESLKEKVKEIGLSLTTVDSKTLSIGLGFLVLKAGELIQNNVPLQEIVDKINQLKKDVKVFFVLKTLEYLRKGGRIGLVEGTLGDILDIKPIISINENGIYYSVAKARGFNRSLNKLIDICKEAVAERKVKLAIMHGYNLEGANKVTERVKGKIEFEEIYSGQIGPALGVHTGPGLVGIAFCPV